MQAKACDIAANTFERTPQVRDEAMRVMQNRRLFADPLYEPNAGAKTESVSPRISVSGGLA